MQLAVKSINVICICKCVRICVTFKTSSRYHYLNVCLSNILIFAVQQSMITAPNLTSKESRKDWETAFSSNVVTPTLKVIFPFWYFEVVSYQLLHEIHQFCK